MGGNHLIVYRSGEDALGVVWAESDPVVSLATVLPLHRYLLNRTLFLLVRECHFVWESRVHVFDCVV